jgi:hypothetical protein
MGQSMRDEGTSEGHFLKRSLPDDADGDILLPLSARLDVETSLYISK